MSPIKHSQQRCSFASGGERFLLYRQLANKTSVFLGPGSYDDQQSFNHLTRVPCSAVIKDVGGSSAGGLKDAAGKGECYYVGDNLVIDPNAKKLIGKKIRKVYRMGLSPNHSPFKETDFLSFTKH